MIEFDKQMIRYVQDNGGLYKRYSIDFIIIFPTESIAESTQHRIFITNLLNQITKLKLAEGKLKNIVGILIV